MRTEKQHKNIVALSDIRRERQIALSPYGPKRAGLTTSRIIEKDQVLTELLNYLEKQVEILENKSLKVLCTFLTDTTHLVEQNLSTTDITGTE